MLDNRPTGLGLGASRDSAPGAQDSNPPASGSAHPGVVVFRWLENALLVVAILALGWYASVRMSTIVQQARDDRALERLVGEREAARPQPADASTAARAKPSSPVADEEAAPPPPDSVIGRVEVPRLGIMAIVREGTTALALSGLAPVPASTTTLAPVEGRASDSSSKRRVRLGAKKTKANATRSTSKKGRGPEHSGRKRGFWGTLSRIFTGR